jgi:hypothetical protein
MMKNMFSPDVLKLMVDHAHNLPDKAVQPGDAWPVHLETPLGSLGTMVVEFTNTLDRWEQYHGRWCAHMNIAGTLKSQPGADLAADSPLKGMKMSIAQASVSGEAVFDLDLGMFVDSTQDLDIKMAVTIPIPAAAARGNAAAPKTQTFQTDVHEVITTTFELK